MNLPPSIVLLPGLHGTSALFEPLIREIPAGYHPVALDFPNTQPLGYEELSALVKERISSIDGPFVIVGESFSGPLSLFVAAQKPPELIGVVLVATFLTFPNLAVGKYLPWRLAFRFARSLFSVRQVFTSGKHARIIDAISSELQHSTPEVLAHRIHSVATVNATEALKACSVPLAYIQGTQDFVVLGRNLRQIQAHKPDVHVEQLPAQHFLLQSHPEQAWNAISRFISNQCRA